MTLKSVITLTWISYLVLYVYVCVYAFSLRRESHNIILGDKPFISEVVLSHKTLKQKFITPMPNLTWLQAAVRKFNSGADVPGIY
jgi:hypothetical protein